MNKKAFTLVELLAVIIILGILSVIIIPKVTEAIENSEKNAAIVSAAGYRNAIDQYYVKKMRELGNFDGNYTVSDKGILVKKNEKHDISFTGTPPKGGYINIKDGSVNSGCLTIGNYKVELKDGEASLTEKGVCPNEPPASQNIIFNENETYIAKVYLDPENLDKICTEEDVNTNTEKNKGCMRWFVFKEDDINDTYTMILDHNTSSKTVKWASSTNKWGPDEDSSSVLYELQQDTSSWSAELETPEDYDPTISGGTEEQRVSYSGYKARLISAEEIAEITKDDRTNGFDISLADPNFDLKSSDFYFDRSIVYYYYDDDDGPNVIPKNNPDTSKYWWLFDNTYDCTLYGCKNGENTDPAGYWTSSPKSSESGTAFAWYVNCDGSLKYHAVYFTSYEGVRPVITVSKSVFLQQ